MKMDCFLFLSLTLLFSLLFCETGENKNKPQLSEKEMDSNLFFKLQQKVECIGCNPTKEELMEYYDWKNTLDAYNDNLSGNLIKTYPRKDFICNHGDKSWYCRQVQRSIHPYFPFPAPRRTSGYQPGGPSLK